MTKREQDEHLLQHLLHMDYNIRRLKRVRWLHTAGRTSSCGILGARSGNAPPQGTVPGGRDGVSLLHRQYSEPGLTMFPRRLSVVTSSASIETIADLEEMDSLYGSATDLDVDSMPVDMATPTGMRRSSSAFAALTFTPEELTSGDWSYGEILKRNVRLWKWSVDREREIPSDPGARSSSQFSRSYSEPQSDPGARSSSQFSRSYSEPQSDPGARSSSQFSRSYSEPQSDPGARSSSQFSRSDSEPQSDPGARSSSQFSRSYSEPQSDPGARSSSQFSRSYSEPQSDPGARSSSQFSRSYSEPQSDPGARSSSQFSRSYSEPQSDPGARSSHHSFSVSVYPAPGSDWPGTDH
ncbi:hypothetical protein BaRGS_00029893 [Batillaria attramentaria]|uniref:Uncharacterized protein n=1 Tax=Batillaria attramentaria TaxID=370345 RepID=A0ABD0JV06_9CAEN